jgi:hypothetical protein
MKGFRLMLGKAATIAIPFALAALISGCGEATEKRAADARTEVVHFFAADAPAVAILRTEPSTDVPTLNRAARSLPAWVAMRARVVAPMRAAGLTAADLMQLVKSHEEIAGIPSSALAFGVPTPADLQGDRPLLVLATDQSDLLASLFRRAVARRKVRPAGQLHDADLYQSPGYGYAIRDGVLVAAARLADVRTAILRRDGDSDLQLDEDVVQSLFNGLGENGPLLVYANLGQLRNGDPALNSLAQRTPWTGMLGPAAVSVRPTPAGLHVEAYANSTGGNLVSGGLPAGTQPTAISVSRGGAASLVPAGPVRSFLTGLSPLSGEATGASDQVRVNLSLGG